MSKISLGLVILTAACGRYGFAALDDAPGGGPDDALDAEVTSSPVLVASATTSASDSSTLRFPLSVPPGADRLLIVSIGIGSACGDTRVGTVNGVTYGGVALAPVNVITGTTCAPNATRSEQWQLAAPAIGTHDVVILLTAPGMALHGGALAFTGIDQTTPVRASKTGSGTDMAASIAVPSVVGDLVVSTVGQGDSIISPGTGQAPAFINNVSSRDTLDNSAASTAPGATPVTSMDWIFGFTDEWQMIASSLRPSEADHRAADPE